MVRIVKADSVKDYLDRYYKKNRKTDTLLDSYEKEYEGKGYVCTSHHDNVTGEFIAWPYYPERGEEKQEICKRWPELIGQSIYGKGRIKR